MDKVRVAILLDSDNNWIEDFVQVLVSFDDLRERFSFSFHKNPDEVRDFPVVFILGYTKVLSAEFLGRNRLNLIVHESDLPAGKGFSPVQWQIIEGKKEIPVRLIEAVASVDSGDIFGRGTIRLRGDELLPEIRIKQAFMTIDLIRGFLTSYPDNKRQPQHGQESFYRRRTVSDDEIDPDKSLRDIFDRFRVADNERHPLWFQLRGCRYSLRITRKG